MAKLGFCGLGQMGAPMARRFLEAGHDLTVWNRTAEKADPVAAAGAAVAASPAEAATGADGVVTMLADPAALREVLLGEAGVAEGLGPDATVIDMSTVGPDAVRGLADERVSLIDAPVLGSVPQAEEGSLRVFVGGPDEAYERWAPVLAAVGTPIHVGPLGAGAAVKLVVNSTLGALMSGLGGALALGDALDLDQSTVLDVLADSPIGVTARSKRERIESGSYPPNFKLALAEKDLRLVTETAGRLGIDLRVAPAAHRWLADAEGAGFGELDYSAVTARIRGREASA